MLTGKLHYIAAPHSWGPNLGILRQAPLINYDVLHSATALDVDFAILSLNDARGETLRFTLRKRKQIDYCFMCVAMN